MMWNVMYTCRWLWWLHYATSDSFSFLWVRHSFIEHFHFRPFSLLHLFFGRGTGHVGQWLNAAWVGCATAPRPRSCTWLDNKDAHKDRPNAYNSRVTRSQCQGDVTAVVANQWMVYPFSLCANSFRHLCICAAFCMAHGSDYYSPECFQCLRI